MFDTQFLAFGTFYLLLDSCTQYSFYLSSKSCHYRDFDGFCAQRQGLERSPLLLHLSEPLPPWTPAGRETQKPEPSTGVPDVMLAELWEGFPWYHIYILLDAIRINYVHFCPENSSNILILPPTDFILRPRMRTVLNFLYLILNFHRFPSKLDSASPSKFDSVSLSSWQLYLLHQQWHLCCSSPLWILKLKTNF